MIHVHDFCKSYGRTLAVSAMSFQVERGEVLGLVGPNGAGKTTTLKGITGIIRPTKGRIVVAGHDIAHDPVSAKKKLAYVPDDPRLFEALTVWEHLEFVAATYRVPDFVQSAEQLLDQFELTDKKNTTAQELSRGMKQKVIICCAYLPRPDVILFDEPLNGLDPRAIRTFKESVAAQADGGAAIIISSHLLSVVEDMCSHLLILDRGAKRFCGLINEARRAFSADSSKESLEDIFFRLTES